MGHSLQAPLGRGPSRPLGGCAVGARGAGFTDRVSHQPCAPAQFGGSAVRSQEAPRGVRKETLEGCSPPLTSPPPLPVPWREMRILLALGQRPCWMKPVSCSSLCSRKCCRLHPDGAAGAGQMDRFLCTPVPCSSETGAAGLGERPQGEKAPGREERAVVAGGFTGGTFFEAPSLCSSSLLSPASLPPQPSLSAPNDPLPWGDS